MRVQSLVWWRGMVLCEGAEPGVVEGDGAMGGCRAWCGGGGWCCVRVQSLVWWRGMVLCEGAEHGVVEGDGAM